MTLVDGGQTHTQHANLSQWYAHGAQLLGGACPLGLVADGGYSEPISERPWRMLLADDECAHGRLAGDPTEACGCWPSELPEPELLEPVSVVHPTRKEQLMLNAAPERLALPAPAPVPAEPDVNAAIAAAAEIEPATRPAPTAVVHATSVPLLNKILADIDAEVALLLEAKAKLLAVVA